MSSTRTAPRIVEEGRGDAIFLTEKVRNNFRRISARSEEYVRKGEEYVSNESRLFGGCPQPGAEGYEDYFMTIKTTS